MFIALSIQPVIVLHRASIGEIQSFIKQRALYALVPNTILNGGIIHIERSDMPSPWGAIKWSPTTAALKWHQRAEWRISAPQAPRAAVLTMCAARSCTRTSFRHM